MGSSLIRDLTSASAALACSGVALAWVFGLGLGGMGAVVAQAESDAARMSASALWEAYGKDHARPSGRKISENAGPNS